MHVLLCGFGRLVATALEAAKIQYIAVGSDLGRFREAQRQGHMVVHGDAAHRRILSAAGLANAKLVVITFDRHASVERILTFVREQEPVIPSMVSTADDQDVTTVVEAGADVVFPENLAAGVHSTTRLSSCATSARKRRGGSLPRFARSSTRNSGTASASDVLLRAML